MIINFIYQYIKIHDRINIRFRDNRSIFAKTSERKKINTINHKT